MRKWKGLFGGLLLAALLVAGCAPEKAPADKSVPVPLAQMTGKRVYFEHFPEGEDVKITTGYKSSYGPSEWTVTDNKDLEIELTLEATKPIIFTAFVEHLHVDISLTSQWAYMDGFKTDTFDDSVHGGDQPGFYVGEYPYRTTMAIEGYSKTLLDGWGYFVSNYGTWSAEEKKLTEKNLRTQGGVDGQKVHAVFDVMIKYEGEDFFHVFSVTDDFAIKLPPYKE